VVLAGRVTATGGFAGAGVGGGRAAGGAVLTVSGGVVTAVGGQLAAGIGGGVGGSGASVAISGGTVTATGGAGGTGDELVVALAGTYGGGSGIGGGGRGEGAPGDVPSFPGGGGGVVGIAGGAVTATAGSADAEPIGAGKDGVEGVFTLGASAVDCITGLTRTITFADGACGSGSVDQAVDVAVGPAGESKAVAIAAGLAAGVAGTSEAVLVRDGVVVPVGSVLSAGIGPRGGVVLTAEDLRVAVASSGGAGSSSGVVVSPGDALEVSIVSALVPGSVVEAWVYSTPRLVGAVRVPDDFVLGDTLVLTVPIGAPLDGGDQIGDGAHALQLRMEATSGFEVLATGMTVGGPVPTSIPTGDGPTAILWSLPIALIVLFVLAGGLGALFRPSRSGWPALRVT
jgi:hypothetical protein